MNAKTALTDISEDERNWWIQNSYDIARRDREEEMQNTLARGRAEGEAQGFVRGCAEGEQKAKLEMVRNALDMGLTLEQTAKLTGLSEEVIRSQCNG